MLVHDFPIREAVCDTYITDITISNDAIVIEFSHAGSKIYLTLQARKYEHVMSSKYYKHEAVRNLLKLDKIIYVYLGEDYHEMWREMLIDNANKRFDTLVSIFKSFINKVDYKSIPVCIKTVYDKDGNPAISADINWIAPNNEGFTLKYTTKEKRLVNEDKDKFEFKI